MGRKFRAGLALALIAAPAGWGQLITPGLQFGTGSMAFTAQAGGTAPAQTIALTCLGPPGSFTVSASSGGGWLAVSPAAGTTPATLSLSVSVAGLLPGTYTGTAQAVSAGSCGTSPPLEVTLTVTPAAGGSYAISPGLLAFSYAVGGAIPAPRAISVSGGSAQTFTVSASSAGGWFSLTPLRASPPAVVTVTVNPVGLKAGIHKAEVIVAPASGPAQRVTVTMTVTGGPAPVTEPVVFTHQPGDPPPGPQAIPVEAGPFLVAAASDGSWLAATPYDQARPSTVTLSVNPAGLAVGSYSGSVTVSYSGGVVETIPVALEVVSNAPRLSSIFNGASQGSTPLAPGEILTIRGTGLGPPAAVEMRVSGGVVASELGGTRVLVNGTPAPVLYAHQSQVNAIAPYGITGRTTVTLQVEYQGRRSAEANFSVQDASPAIFTIDGSGRGQAAMLNEDTSLNFDLNPADRGRVAVLYAAGAGLMSPPAVDGQITGTPLAYPVLGVSVLVDGRDAEVLYAGSAPGIVSGALQVNFRVPETVRTGPAVGVILKVGRFTSQTGVTMAVR